jgi:hypothetical protein
MRRDYEDKALVSSGPARPEQRAPAPGRPPAPPGVLPERPDAEYLLEPPPKRRKRRTWPSP